MTDEQNSAAEPRGRIDGSRGDKQLAEKALHAKSKIKLTL